MAELPKHARKKLSVKVTEPPAPDVFAHRLGYDGIYNRLLGTVVALGELAKFELPEADEGVNSAIQRLLAPIVGLPPDMPSAVEGGGEGADRLIARSNDDPRTAPLAVWDTELAIDALTGIATISDYGAGEIITAHSTKLRDFVRPRITKIDVSNGAGAVTFESVEAALEPHEQDVERIYNGLRRQAKGVLDVSAALSAAVRRAAAGAGIGAI
jgi:hypothetical protein